MGNKNKVNMPQTSAGLTRYFEEVKSKFSFRPQAIIIFVIIVIIIELVLHSQGLKILGI